MLSILLSAFMHLALVGGVAGFGHPAVSTPPATATSIRLTPARRPTLE